MCASTTDPYGLRNASATGARTAHSAGIHAATRIAALSNQVVLAALGPASVARIDVLEDAAAAGAYGARGGNGVIVITLRRAWDDRRR